jgi:hypothetical protein
MSKKEKIEQEIQKTLDQFENTEQLPPNPYFYSRVQARLKETGKQQHIFSAILRPALLTTLVAVNLGTAYWYLTGNEQQSQINTREQLVEILEDDLTATNEQNNLFIFE